MKLRCLIVEDEPIAQEIILSYARRLDELEVAGQFRNAIDAAQFLEREHVDLLFLDIRMPRMSGLDLLRKVERKPKVIITSAYREFAMDAFDLDVVDYLLKPISFERFLKAVSKVQTLGDIITSSSIKLATPFIFVKGNKQLQKVYIDHILYLESQRDYIRIRLEDGTEVITRQTISYYEQFLPAAKFLRVHRSFIVAIHKITAFEANSVLTAKYKIPVGRNYKQLVTEQVRHLSHNGG
jgi:DNA-binding LytR/AlgR family response regulator